MDPFTGWVLDALAPLQYAMGSPGRLRLLLRDLGWDVAVSDRLFADDGPLGDTVKQLKQLLDEAETLRATVAGLGDGEDAPAAVIVQILEISRAVIGVVQSLKGAEVAVAAIAAEADAIFTDPTFWTELAGELPGFLLIRALKRRSPITFALLFACGIIETEAISRAAGKTVRIDRMRWERLPDLVTRPSGLLAETYGWGTAFDHTRLRDAIVGMSLAAGRPLELSQPSSRFYGDGPTGFFPDETAAMAVHQITTALVAGRVPGAGWVELGLEMVPIPNGGSEITGVYFGGYALGQVGGVIKLSEDWRLELAADASASLGGIRLDPSLAAPQLIAPDVATSFALALVGEPRVPWRLLSLGAGPSLSASRFGFAVRLDDDELTIEGGIDLALALGLETGDSFVRETCSDGSTSLVIQPVLGWSSRRGVYFAGGTELDITLQLGKQLGPLWIDHVDLSLSAQQTGLSFAAGVTGGLILGPIAAVIEGIGLSANLDSADDADSGGGLRATIALKPPTGIGLAIDAPPISGGGYLFHDASKGEYAGVAQLTMGSVGITAIGMLATKMPDGSEGWSLFLSLAATFTGLQLGFGFTLNGLGGIIGVNRSLDEVALGDGVRTGALDAILFPKNPVADAPRILAALDAVFPKKKGQYVFGPIAKIGWGTPTLIEVNLGIIIQLPNPLTISLLGSLAAVLPTKEAPLLVLHVDVAGTLNVTEGTLRISASLRDSRILALELTGDMEVRASFLDNPTFLVAIGGFHPDFTPPPGFPAMRRLAVALDTGDTVRIQLGGYFALTSNTVQFGASLTLWASGAGFTADGGTSFDALIQFSPFHFTVAIHAWLTVRALGVDLLSIDLAARLDGPSPWSVSGKASFKIVGVKKSLDVAATFGKREADAPKAVVRVEELLIAELQRADAWSAAAPDGDPDPVVLVEQAADACEVHPAGRIRVAQRLVPLGVRLEHYGAADLAGAEMFELTALRLGATPTNARDDVSEWFATAQYFQLSQQEKLAAPSFERLTAGVVFGGEGASAGRPSDFTCDHEVVYRDPNVRAVGRERPGTVTTTTAEALARAVRSGVALGLRATTRMPRSTKSAGVFSVTEPSYVAIEGETGAVAGGTAGSYVAARSSVKKGELIVQTYERELMK